MIDIAIGVILVTLGYFLGRPNKTDKKEFTDTVVEYYGGHFYEMER